MLIAAVVTTACVMCCHDHVRVGFPARNPEKLMRALGHMRRTLHFSCDVLS